MKIWLRAMSTLFQARAKLSWSGAEALAPKRGYKCGRHRYVPRKQSLSGPLTCCEVYYCMHSVIESEITEDIWELKAAPGKILFQNLAAGYNTAQSLEIVELCLEFPDHLFMTKGSWSLVQSWESTNTLFWNILLVLGFVKMFGLWLLPWCEDFERKYLWITGQNNRNILQHVLTKEVLTNHSEYLTQEISPREFIKASCLPITTSLIAEHNLKLGNMSHCNLSPFVYKEILWWVL